MSTMSFANSATNTGNAVKKSLLILPAAGITMALFYGMAALISSGPLTTKAPLPAIDISLVTPPPPSKVQEKPKLQPPPVAPLPPVRTQVAIDGPGEGLPSVLEQTPPVVGIGTTQFAMTGPSDRGATPVVRINPKYPPIAARDGLSGWVKLSFTIDEVGQVIDVQVVDAEPKRVFDKEAVRALKGWKYQPQVENGIAVKQTGMQVQLDFNLETDA
jgi:protein TonB